MDAENDNKAYGSKEMMEESRTPSIDDLLRLCSELNQRKAKYVIVGRIRPREITEQMIDFSRKGKYRDNGRVFNFRVIQNASGSCYDLDWGRAKPCPREPFLMKEIVAPKNN